MAKKSGSLEKSIAKAVGEWGNWSGFGEKGLSEAKAVGEWGSWSGEDCSSETMIAGHVVTSMRRRRNSVPTQQELI